MSDSPYDSDFPKPSKITSGKFSYGSVFSLIRELRGSKYNIGDKFILVEQEDCVDPNILKLGGVGETYFLDNTGSGLIIHADDNQINSLFEHLSMDPDTSLEVTSGPSLYITDSQFSQFKSNIAEALSRIANLIPSTGSTGSIGKDGDKGDKGDKGDTGSQGIQGDKGDTGLQGDKGDTGLQGIQGDIGLPGLQGIRGIQGTSGEKGDKGDKGDKGISGTPGIKGDKGLRGDQGDRGVEGPKGDKGQTGVAGPKGDKGIQGTPGIKGNDGKAGSRGTAGVKGNTGSSGVISAKFPLSYDAEEQSISIDEDRLDRILKKIMGGGRVSPQDMGWFASTGGGGKVAIKYNGAAITPDVRAIDFTGSGVASVTKIGGKVTVNITGGGGEGSTGATGATGATGPQGGNAGRIYYLWAGVTAAGFTGYKTASTSPSSSNAETIITTAVSGTSDIFVASFITDVGEPGVYSLPTGIAERLIHVYQTGNENCIAKLNFQLWKRDLTGAETLLRNGYSENFSNQTKAELRWTVAYATPFSFLTTDRLVFKVYATRVGGPANFNVITSYEGQDVSYVKTTISAGAIGPQGPQGPQGATGATAGTTAGSYLSITNNAIKLDLQTGATANLSVGASKYDFIPILTIQNPTGVNAWNTTGFSGPTQLISVPTLLNSAFPNIGQIESGATSAANPLRMGIADGLTQAFNISAIGVTAGSKTSLFNITTDGEASLAIGVPTNITGQLTVSTIDVNTISGVNTINSTSGNITIDASSGVTFTGPIRGSTIYLTGDLVVTGRIVTSTGVFGATANNIIEPVSDMIMDGGEF